MSRVQKTRVEFRAITVPFVSSLGASTNASNRNSALTLVSACSVSWQVADIPLQAPPQPANLAPPVAVAARVTVLPLASVTSQVDDESPQFKPAPVMVPGPLVEADRCTCDGRGGGCTTKFAYTVASFERVTVQSPPPLQSVPQPAKLKPLSAVAVSVTEVPAAKSAAQVEESQSKPPGE